MSSDTPSGGVLLPFVAQAILLDELLFSDSEDEVLGMQFIDSNRLQ